MTDAKLGYIDFLNSLPVYQGLETGAVPLPKDVWLTKAPPTTLNRRLLAGEVQVSPVSSIEYARHADELVLLPDLSIASTGFVHSVCLFYRNGLDTLENGRVCVTDQSAASDLLLRILLEKRFGLQVERVKGEPDLEEIGHSYDGALLIGDDALRAALAYPNMGRIDLGEEWHRWTGNPMVFAVWVARKDFARDHPVLLSQIHAALKQSKEWGRKNRGEIVERARKRAFLSRAYMERYFNDLNYDLDERKLAGLLKYYQYAHELGDIASVPPVAPLEVSLG